MRGVILTSFAGLDALELAELPNRPHRRAAKW
jgi:hypothetical protein